MTGGTPAGGVAYMDDKNLLPSVFLDLWVDHCLVMTPSRGWADPSRGGTPTTRPADRISRQGAGGRPWADGWAGGKIAQPNCSLLGICESVYFSSDLPMDDLDEIHDYFLEPFDFAR